jgi:hypothetical protein
MVGRLSGICPGKWPFFGYQVGVLVMSRATWVLRIIRTSFPPDNTQGGAEHCVL